MSDTTTTKPNSGWSDDERLAYLVSLLEHSDTKLNFKTAPLPPGRTVIACERMVSRLRVTLKAELDALKNGTVLPAAGTEGAKKKTGTTTPRKRKTKGDVDVGAEAEGKPSPKKKGRVVKSETVVKDEDEEVEAQGEVLEEI